MNASKRMRMLLLRHLFFILAVFIRASVSLASEMDGFNFYLPEAPVEDSGLNEEVYIAPNELEFYKFSPSLKGRTGTLVSVGTFRALQAASVGDFEEVYLLDYNHRVNQFNNLHLSLIAVSKNRQDYLNRLFDHSGIADLMDRYMQTPMPLYDRNEQFKFILWSERHCGVHLGNAIALLEEKNLRKQPRAFQLMDGYLYKIAKIMMKQDVYVQSFMGSDELFNKLKYLVDHKKIYVLHGSLAGDKSMDWMAQRLRTRRLKISVLDLSNSYSYIASDKNVQPFFQNVLKQPWSTGAVVHFTEPNRTGISGWHSWTYKTQKASEFFESKAAIFGAEVQNIVRNSFLNFEAILSEGAGPQFDQNCYNLMK